jgi:toxin-antitoxin system PIN domain toxin
VIVVDANLLLYAYDSASAHHVPARRWLESVLSAAKPVGIPWQSIGAFIRVLTNPRLPGNRFGLDEAVEIVDSWLQCPNVVAFGPESNYWSHFQETLLQGQATGPLASDAQIAALTKAVGGTLHTTDRDFTRFPGLRWVNPL